MYGYLADEVMRMLDDGYSEEHAEKIKELPRSVIKETLKDVIPDELLVSLRQHLGEAIIELESKVK